jgi:hypothetical protein
MLKYAAKIFSNKCVNYQRLVAYFDLISKSKFDVNQKELNLALLGLITNRILRIRMAQYCKSYELEFEVLNDLILNAPKEFSNFVETFGLNIENIPNQAFTDNFIMKYISEHVLHNNDPDCIKNELTKIIKSNKIDRLKFFTTICRAIDASPLSKDIQRNVKTDIYRLIQQTNTEQHIKIYFLG